MIPYFTSEQIHQSLPWATLIPALREAFRAAAVTPRRHAHALSPSGSSTLLLMPVWQVAGHLGIKLVTVVPENRNRQLPTVQALFVLLDTETGTPLALMEGEALTLRRTAAASALASTYLSRADSAHLLIIGTGQLAPFMASAHCAVRDIRQVSVWGRDAQRAHQTLEKIRAVGLPASTTVFVEQNLNDALRRADIISCATTSHQPLVTAAAVRPGTHIDLVGGFKPDMREADDALMGAASLFVDSFDGALAEAGDLVQPLQAGLISRSQVLAELADLTAIRHPGRSDSDQITVFKSVGTALEDLCAADQVWQRQG